MPEEQVTEVEVPEPPAIEPVVSATDLSDYFKNLRDYQIECYEIQVAEDYVHPT